VIVSETEFNPHWGDVGVFTNAAKCSECHTASTDGSGVMRLPQTAQGADISPAAGWRHSLMAHAWNDPYFQATVEDQVAEFSAYAGNIEDKCLTCHSPMAHTTAHATGQGLSTSDCSLNGSCYRIETAEQDNHAREGVSCTVRHQMRHGGEELNSGNYSIAGEDDENARIIYGPFSNPRTQPMANNTQYQVARGDYISASEHCGSCHELDTPTFDINTGHPAAPAQKLREQAAYSEWNNSSYADGGADDRSCQDCHTQGPGNYQTPIAIMRSGSANPGWPQREPFSLHSVAGGNTYVLGLLKTWRKELGIADTTTEAGFDQAIASGRASLGRAATVALLSPQLNGNELELDVRIENRTGHKLPTGYPSRRMWLHLTVSDATGKVLFESGKPDDRGNLALDAQQLAPACLALAKDESFSNAYCYVPHRNDISDARQVPVYESVMADTNGHIVYSLLYGATYLKDNRIPPAGFSSDGANYDVATASVGAALGDSDFNREEGRQGSGSDTVHYEIELDKNAAGPLSVDVRLWYQSIRPAFLASMSHRGEKTDRLRLMTQQQPPLPELLARQTLVVPPRG
jgi:hypothetical protein